MNTASIVILSVLLLVLFADAVYLFRRRGKRSCSCGGGCAYCTGHCNCKNEKRE